MMMMMMMRMMMRMMKILQPWRAEQAGLEAPGP